MTLDGISVQEAIDLAKKVVSEIEASDMPLSLKPKRHRHPTPILSSSCAATKPSF